jgi:hypothetical protein
MHVAAGVSQLVSAALSVCVCGVPVREGMTALPAGLVRKPPFR